jgi:hypothetical protein
MAIILKMNGIYIMFSRIILISVNPVRNAQVC